MALTRRSGRWALLLAPCALLAGCGLAVGERLPAPADLSITAPSPDVPRPAASFSGVWTGLWGSILKHMLVVERVDESTATIVYSWGSQPRWGQGAGWTRQVATIERDGTLSATLSNGARVTYTLARDGRALTGRWSQGSTSAQGTFYLEPATSVAIRPAPPVQRPRAERPTYVIGDQWVRTDGFYELLSVEDDRYVFRAGPDREVQLTKNLAVARATDGARFVELEPPPVLSWPLEVGGSGTSEGVWRDETSPATGWKATFRWTVTDYTDVEIGGATKVSAFRVAETLTLETGRRLEIVRWYAPTVQRFVRVDADETLLAFRVVSLDPPQGLPPEIAIGTPNDQQRLDTDSLVLDGVARAARGLTRLTVALNGTQISTSGEREGVNELPLRVPVRLREGRNVLIVTAVDSLGQTRQFTRTVYYEKAQPPPSSTGAVGGALLGAGARSGQQPFAGILGPASVSGVAPRRPIKLAVSTPTDNARVGQETVALAAVVSEGAGISHVAIALNGVETARFEESGPRPSFVVNLPVKLREGENTIVVTAIEANGAVHQEVRTVHYDRAVPLTIAFRYPEDRARVTDESTVVAALATSSKGVAATTVIVNGAQVYQEHHRPPRRSVAVAAPVTLREGPNALILTAVDAEGVQTQEVRTVVLERPKFVVPAPTPPTRHHWAVVIGIGQYEYSEIPRLRYAVPDADAVYQTLIGPGGFKKEHVLLLTDRTDRKPTLRNVKWALGTFLARSARKDDTVLIFCAGHGAPEIDQRGLERDGLAKYLVPSDADPDDLFSTALPMDDIPAIFGRIEAERVVVFLDTCYSGAAGGRTFASKKTRGSHIDELFLERLTRARGRAIVTASRSAEVSIELDELGHGLFTYYLVAGLKGAADLNRDGIVSLQELYEYVEQHMSQKSRAVGGSQHPVMKGELEGALPLVKAGGL